MLAFLSALWNNKVTRGIVIGFFIILGAFFLYKGHVNSIVAEKLAQQTIEQLVEVNKHNKIVQETNNKILENQNDILGRLNENTEKNLNYITEQTYAIGNEPTASNQSSKVLKDTVKSLEERFK